MNQYWFLGNPFATTPTSLSGFPVRMTTGLGIPAAGTTNRFLMTAFHARRFLTSGLSSRANGVSRGISSRRLHDHTILHKDLNACNLYFNDLADVYTR